ncbi:MAG: PAS domain-containing protein [Eubacterium sp.]|nr:PAS domain-containing protein [Eubacterium sp.]
MIRELSAEQSSFITQNSGDAVCIVSSTGYIEYANPAMEKLFGIDSNSNIKLWDAIPFIADNDDLIQLFLDAIYQKMDSHEDIVNYRDNEDKLHNFHVRIICPNEDKLEILVVITDLTQLLRLNKAFERYTSRDIAKYVLETPDGHKRGGINKEVSILMSDLRGFTSISTKLPPDELIVILNHYFEKMSAIIEKNNGTIIEFLGDGIFVVFGAPSDLPDHASLAVKCAIEMENAMDEVNKWNIENGYPELEMGIGINSGLAIVGNIGSENKMKYGCMGATVNLTGRVEGLAVGEQIYITENVQKLISEELIISDETSILPKGASKLLKVLEIEGIGDLQLHNRFDKNLEWIDRTDDNEYPFFMLDGKTVDEEKFIGKLIRITKDKKYSILSTEAVLDEKANIMIKINNEYVYAKVMAEEEDGYRIRFTSGNKEILS